MCTRAMWTGSGHGVLVGRNMDWREEMDTNLWSLPRGVDRIGHDRDPDPVTWTARYGSLVAAVWDNATSDGINERGLAAHVLCSRRRTSGNGTRNCPRSRCPCGRRSFWTCAAPSTSASP
ncbi:linear amide C-N hydrolase [Rhodococcus aetherivorans]|uniref:linear amide C-N hydrolase n=1 Tax=Rhodococcus aetherivorans TaxID=191292 RepID=UPI002E0F1332